MLQSFLYMMSSLLIILPKLTLNDNHFLRAEQSQIGQQIWLILVLFILIAEEAVLFLVAIKHMFALNR